VAVESVGQDIARLQFQTKSQRVPIEHLETIDFAKGVEQKCWLSPSKKGNVPTEDTAFYKFKKTVMKTMVFPCAFHRKE
jgi:hypothetical protein